MSKIEAVVDYTEKRIQSIEKDIERIEGVLAIESRPLMRVAREERLHGDKMMLRDLMFILRILNEAIAEEALQ